MSDYDEEYDGAEEEVAEVQEQGVGMVNIRSIDSANASKAIGVTLEQAVQQCKDYMGDGKWLNIINTDGSSQVISDAYEYFGDNEKEGRFRDRISDVEEVQIMVALAGGEDEEE